MRFAPLHSDSRIWIHIFFQKKFGGPDGEIERDGSHHPALSCLHSNSIVCARASLARSPVMPVSRELQEDTTFHKLSKSVRASASIRCCSRDGGPDKRPHSPAPLFAHWSLEKPCSLQVLLHDVVSATGSPCHFRCRNQGKDSTVKLRSALCCEHTCLVQEEEAGPMRWRLTCAADSKRASGPAPCLWVLP